jgi:glycerol uptake facilitator-like aquaporin
MMLSTAVSTIAGLARTTRAALALYIVARAYAAMLAAVAIAAIYRGSREDVYNILWAVVFGFATINILSLAARRLEPTRRGLSFGEFMAVMVVLLSVFLLGWEMLSLFHIFPIKLKH